MYCGKKNIAQKSQPIWSRDINLFRAQTKNTSFVNLGAQILD